MDYFSKLHTNNNKIEVKLDLPNYTTKSDLKNAAGFNTSKLAKKAVLTSLKSEVDKLDIDQLAELDAGKLNLVQL